MIRNSFLWVAILWLGAFSQEDYLESTSAGVRLKVGLVQLVADQGLEAQAKEIEELLVFDLERDGRTFLYQNEKVHPLWISRGVQFYIHGRLQKANHDQFFLELNISDMYSGTLMHGKMYNIKKKQLRQAGHDFSEECLFQMYGEKGVASSKILYVHKGKSKNIYLSDYDGFNSQALTQGEQIKTFPVWGPNDESFFYTSFEKGYPSIFHQNLSSGSRQPILGQEARGFGGSFHKHKGLLAYSGQTGINTDLWTYDLKSGKRSRLTTSGAAEFSPFWFPNGEQLAYASDRGGNPQVYVLDQANGNSNRVTFYGKYNESPAVSPQGDKLVYCSMDEGRLNIYVLDLRSGDVMQLTANQGDNESPSWSPDGRMIVFSSTRSGQSDLYIMRDDGTGLTRITRNGGNFQPKWSQPKWAKERTQ